MGVLAVLAARRAFRPLVDCAVVFAVGAVLFGLLDRLTWGSWFHSALEYLRFNVVEGKASGFGTADALYYVRYLYESMPVLAVVALLLAVRGAPRAWGLSALALAFFVAHSLVPHKELRFVFPFLPLFFALGGVGVGALFGRWQRGAGAVLAVAELFSAASFHGLTFRDLGAYLDGQPDRSAYDDAQSVNRLLTLAGTQPDLCGIAVAVHLAWSGGYTYLDRDVPLYGGGLPPPSPRAYNYLIAPVGPAVPAVAREGAFALVKRFPGPCAPDPSYSSRLP